MRLTLRTMLAYLDDVLEADDAREIGKKVDESQFATDLAHRIRGCVRRLRLPAPPLDGQGMGLDPNSVAEYLDSTLPDEQVPDFEKVCLDSDLQLAEAASCHQILTLVLGEPAQIEPATRERIYRIGQTSAPATVEQKTTMPLSEVADTREAIAAYVSPSAGEAVLAAQQQPANTESRRKPEIPEYLREDTRSSWWPVVATFLFAGLITLGLFRLAGPFDRSHPVFLALSQSASDRQSTEQSLPPLPYDGPLLDEPSGELESATGNGPIVTDMRPLDETAGAPQVANPEFPEITETGPAPEISTVEGPAENVVDFGTGDQVAVTTPHEGGVVPATALSAAAGDSVDTNIEPLPSDGDESVKTASGSDELADDEVTDPVDIGRLLSDEDVLIRLDSESGMWQRIPPQTAVFTQEKLLTLPTYRPQILLGTGVIQIKAFGGSRIEMGGSAEAPLLQVDFGRLLLVPVGQSEARVSLRLPGRDVNVVFVDAESALAVEVSHIHAPGADSSQWLPHDVVRLFPTTGGVKIEADSIPSQEVMAGTSWFYVDDANPEFLPIENNPDWIDGADLRDIDRIASHIIESALGYERPVGLMLAEKTESSQERRIEARTLAIRCLTFLDEFEPAIRALADSEQRNWWQMHFTALQESLSRSHDTADRVRAALQKHRGQDADLLLRLLSGYAPDELQAGGASELVGFLDHDKLDIRVLANENLRLITGTRPIYNPAETPAKRKGAIRRWQHKLEEGLIAYHDVPLDMPPRRRLEAADDASDNAF